MRPEAKTGVGGTVDAFNFIRRVGFPSTPRVLTIFLAITFVSATVSLGVAGEGPLQILVFATAVMSIPPIIGELVSSTVLLRGDKILDFRRLIGLEIISDLPIVGFLFLFAIIGLALGRNGLWADGFLTGLVVSLPIRFLTPLAMSSLKTWRRLLAAGFTPVLMLGSYLIIFPGLVSTLQVYLLMVAGLAVSGFGTSLIIRNVDAEG